MNQFYNNYKKQKQKSNFITGIIIITILLAIVGSVFFRFDFEAGSHKITPTAVDTDFWGNYKVYYRTTDFTKNSEEDFYYIEKGNTQLAEQIQECIKSDQTVVVYYEKYTGLKGFTAPQSSPVIKIEIVQ